MKRYKYIKWVLPVVFMFSITGCIDDDLNSDPTKSTNMDPNLQITTIEVAQTNNMEDWHRFFIYPSGFMNQLTNDWAVINYGGRGQKNDGYFELLWRSYYLNNIKNVVDVVQRTNGNAAQVNVNSVARILRVQNFLRLTDFYGDIPYSEAGMGYYNGSLKPKYDKQQDIYNDFFKELKEASEALNPQGDILTGDLFYKGDVSKWKKFANSLRLRIAMRLIKVDPAKAELEAKAAIAAGVFTSNADICYIKHDNVQNNPATQGGSGSGIANRLFDGGKESTFRIAKELIEVMEKNKDPRILFYAGSYLDNDTRTDITEKVREKVGSYANMALDAQRFGWEVPAPTISIEVDEKTISVIPGLQRLQPSKLITNWGSPYIHMSYAEVEFLLAEAAFRWNADGTPASHYEKALRASVEQWTLFGGVATPDAINTFVTDNPLTAGKELELINTQLWVLHFLDPFETWSNWRRTGMPSIPFYNYDPTVNQSEGQTPRRLQYPLEEQLKNPANYKEAVARMGGTDSWLNRVWWDKN